MKWFNNQNLKLKVMILLGLPFGVLLIVSSLVVLGSTRLQGDLDYLVEKDLNSYINFNELFTQGFQVGRQQGIISAIPGTKKY